MLLWLIEALKTPHFLFDWSMKKWCKYVMLIYSWPSSQKWNFEKILKNIGVTNFQWAIFLGVLGKWAQNDLNSADYGQISLYFSTYHPIQGNYTKRGENWLKKKVRNIFLWKFQIFTFSPYYCKRKNPSLEKSLKYVQIQPK